MTALLSDPGLLLLTLFIVMLVLRVPIAISLGLSAAVVAWKFDMGIDMLPYNFFAGVAKVPLLAIPFFVWSAAATEECVWEDLAGILSTGALSSTKDGDGSQSFRQASRTRRRR